MRELLEDLLRGEPHAVALCMTVFEAANDYDHLHDNDGSDKSREQMLHDMAWALAVTIPQNPFYRAFHVELTASLANALSSWRTSTVFERSGKLPELQIAHVLRWSLIEFFLHCARLVGGAAWEQEKAPGFWRAMTKDHSFGQFAAEHLES